MNIKQNKITEKNVPELIMNVNIKQNPDSEIKEAFEISIQSKSGYKLKNLYSPVFNDINLLFLTNKKMFS
jgi:hypothetical protein